MVVGIDRQNKLVPQLIQFHLAHQHETEWLTHVGSPTDRLIPQDNVEGVLTRPHVDGKNLALMMCVVFVWGNFRHKEKAWLVLWEAGLIIKLRPGCLLSYPSSLFTHFNVNIQDCTIVTTENDADPTPDNSTPINGVKGCGSVVLFNQATMFQLAKLGSTVKKAKENSVKAMCDNMPHINSLPRPV
ncbi:hypothetical protein C8Q76DRAFT_803615 [Earliella scabrosa]|nr:hypothetical protein C8Q76DRAFT_803615 [Earliella scabrosa]